MPQIQPSCKPGDWSIRVSHRQPRSWEGSKVHNMAPRESLGSRLVDAIRTLESKFRKKN